MTTKLLEALTLAEETLRDIVRVFKFETGTPVEALATIRAAKAQEQAKQEPVTRHNIIGYRPINNSASVIAPPKNPNGKPRPPCNTKLYAAPVRTKDLTDDEIEAAVLSVNTTMEAWITYRAVIAAHEEKNK